MEASGTGLLEAENFLEVDPMKSASSAASSAGASCLDVGQSLYEGGCIADSVPRM